MSIKEDQQLADIRRRKIQIDELQRLWHRLEIDYKIEAVLKRQAEARENTISRHKALEEAEKKRRIKYWKKCMKDERHREKVKQRRLDDEKMNRKRKLAEQWERRYQEELKRLLDEDNFLKKYQIERQRNIDQRNRIYAQQRQKADKRWNNYLKLVRSKGKSKKSIPIMDVSVSSVVIWNASEKDEFSDSSVETFTDSRQISCSDFQESLANEGGKKAKAGETDEGCSSDLEILNLSVVSSMMVSELMEQAAQKLIL